MSRTLTENFPAYSAIIGSGIWLFFEALAEFHIFDLHQIEVAFLLAPLVVVPLGLRLVILDRTSRAPQSIVAVAAYFQPLAALAAAISYLFPQGLTAGALAGVWFSYTAVLAALALVRFNLDRKFDSAEGAINAGLLYSVIGGLWFVLHRLGAAPFQFGHLIVLLTAVHFHFAGFASLIFIGAAGRRLKRDHTTLMPLHSIIAFATFLSIPLLAVGIALSPLLEAISAIILALALGVMAVLVLTVIVRTLKRKLAKSLLILSSLSLVVGMAFAILYAVSEVSGTYVITITQMAHYHGWANALLFAVCGLWAWNVSGE